MGNDNQTRRQDRFQIIRYDPERPHALSSLRTKLCWERYDGASTNRREINDVAGYAMSDLGTFWK